MPISLLFLGKIYQKHSYLKHDQFSRSRNWGVGSNKQQITLPVWLEAVDVAIKVVWTAPILPLWSGTHICQGARKKPMQGLGET